MKWFRFYHDAIDDPKVQRLPGDVFKFWVNLLCLASRSNERGVVTAAELLSVAAFVEDGQGGAQTAGPLVREFLTQAQEGR